MRWTFGSAPPWTWCLRRKTAGVWMDCAISVFSPTGSHWALCHAALEIKGDSEVQGNAPQTSAKWTEFRQNVASYLQHRGGRQTLPGAVGFWVSSELPVCCVGRLCFVHSCGVFVLIKLFLWINSTFLAFALLSKVTDLPTNHTWFSLFKSSGFIQYGVAMRGFTAIHMPIRAVRNSTSSAYVMICFRQYVAQMNANFAGCKLSLTDEN